MNKKIMPKIIALCFAILVCLSGNLAAAAPVLKLDVANEELRLPNAFRSTAAADSLENVETSGLKDLNISGSAQFSALELAALLREIPQRPLVIVDLRQECHGFLDGAAVSWYGKNNWDNQERTLSEVTDYENLLLDELQAAASADVALNFKASGKSPDAPLTKLAVHNASNEAALAASYGVSYLRIPATDHLLPGDSQVDAFLNFYRTLPPGTWLHFHCHAGHGRTTSFMAMYDILRNQGRIELDDTLKRQYELGGINLAKAPKTKKGWEVKAYEDRLNFLKQFHAYVSSGANLSQTWTQWKEMNAK